MVGSIVVLSAMAKQTSFRKTGIKKRTSCIRFFLWLIGWLKTTLTVHGDSVYHQSSF